MSDRLLDSTVVIDFLRGRQEAVNYLNSLLPVGAPLTHVVVVAEVIRGARDRREQAAIEASIAPFQIVAPDEADARASLDLLRRYRLSHGIGWADCLIAATAIRRDLIVVTTNVKHFTPIPGLRVLRPY
jgi:predicted nucleic acid-binding protein